MCYFFTWQGLEKSVVEYFLLKIAAVGRFRNEKNLHERSAEAFFSGLVLPGGGYFMQNSIFYNSILCLIKDMDSKAGSGRQNQIQDEALRLNWKYVLSLHFFSNQKHHYFFLIQKTP